MQPIQPSQLTSSPSKSIFPIHESIRSRDIYRFDELIRTPRINIHAQDRKGYTPLLQAIDEKQPEMALALIERDYIGLSVNQPDNEGITPLLLAIHNEQQVVVLKLLEHPHITQSAINQTVQDGIAPLF